MTISNNLTSYIQTVTCLWIQGVWMGNTRIWMRCIIFYQ